jgi:uncharacterized protein (TIGR02118 family)
MQIHLSIYDLDGETPEKTARLQETRDRLNRSLPGLQMLLPGSLRSGLESWGQGRHLPGAQAASVPGRGELLVFNSDIAAAEAFASPAGQELAAASHCSLSNLRTFSAHGQAVVPFDGRRAGEPCWMTIAGLVFDPDFGPLEQAEHHYVAEHSRLAGRLPGCRAYLIGIVEREQGESGSAVQPHRLALGIFDDEASLRAALTSPAGEDLERDAQGFSKVAELYFLDARIGL